MFNFYSNHDHDQIKHAYICHNIFAIVCTWVHTDPHPQAPVLDPARPVLELAHDADEKELEKLAESALAVIAEELQFDPDTEHLRDDHDFEHDSDSDSDSAPRAPAAVAGAVAPPQLNEGSVRARNSQRVKLLISVRRFYR